nr:protein G49 [Equid gammaherpesvirus 5]
MAFTIPQKTVRGTLHDYHIPNEAAVLTEYRSISVTDPRQPFLSKPKTCVERSVFLLEICKSLFINKQQELHILQMITNNICYFLRQLWEVTRGCEDSLHELIVETQRYSPRLSHWIGARLLALLKKRYPEHAPSKLLEGLTEESITVWCRYHMTRVQDEVNILGGFLENSGAVYSLSKFSSVAAQLLAQQTALPRQRDPAFNAPYNLAVFWVGVLKKFEKVFGGREVDDHLICYTTVIKYDVAAACEALRGAGGERPVSEGTLRLLDWLTFKLREFNVNSCDSHASELISLLRSLKWQHLV